MGSSWESRRSLETPAPDISESYLVVRPLGSCSRGAQLQAPAACPRCDGSGGSRRAELRGAGRHQGSDASHPHALRRRRRGHEDVGGRRRAAEATPVALVEDSCTPDAGRRALQQPRHAWSRGVWGCATHTQSCPWVEVHPGAGLSCVIFLMCHVPHRGR
eukprot:1140353-Pyramimonas_sp.AAC.1